MKPTASKKNNQPKNKGKKHLYIMGKKVTIPWKAIGITVLVLAILFGIFYLFMRPSVADLFVKNGNQQYNKQNEASAEKYYSLALTLDRKNADARISLVDLYIKQEKYDEAEKLLRDGIEIRKGYVDYYKKLIDLYIKSDHVEKALEFLSTIDQDYVLRQLNKDRPASLFFSPAQGKYERSTKVTLSAGDGEKIYYTTDGTVPNLNSSVYESPIEIKTGKITVRAFAINEKGLISDELVISYDINTDDQRIKFTDEKVEKMIRNEIGNSKGTVYPRDLSSVTSLSNYTKSGAKIDGNIESLDDLQWLPSLTNLSLSGEPNIKSLQPIKACTNIKELKLSNCALNNESAGVLSGLTGIEELDVSQNSIDSFEPFQKMLALNTLNIANNSFTNLSGIDKLKSLSTLDISYNKIKSLKDISSLYLLKTLNAQHNTITSLEDIKQLKKITSIDMTSNLLKSLSGMEKMSDLRYINVSQNTITDFSALKNITLIEELNVSNNALYNIKWANSLPIKVLDISENKIVDISDAESIRELVSINFNNNKVVNVSPLASLSSLETIYMNNNSVRDISALSNCTALKNVYCKDNKIEKVPAMKNNANVFTS